MTRGPNPVRRQRREAGDLRDQPVDVEAVEEATDLSTVRVRVIAEAAGELGAQVAVREPVHGVLPAHEGDEELVIGPGHGIEGLDRSALRRALARGHGVQTRSPGGGVLYVGQCVEIPRGALRRDVAIAEEVGLSGPHAVRRRPRRRTRRRTRNSSGSLITVSPRRTHPAFSSIFSQVRFMRCLMRRPGKRPLNPWSN
jgi:hypothetical protein